MRPLALEPARVDVLFMCVCASVSRAPADVHAQTAKAGNVTLGPDGACGSDEECFQARKTFSDLKVPPFSGLKGPFPSRLRLRVAVDSRPSPSRALPHSSSLEEEEKKGTEQRTGVGAKE